MYKNKSKNEVYYKKVFFYMSNKQNKKVLFFWNFYVFRANPNFY